MKHLKKPRHLKLTEWINNIMDYCKDIMIDLYDQGMDIRVRRSLFMEEKNEVLVECLISYHDDNWKGLDVKYVINRLTKYLGSEGFSLEKEGNIEWLSSKYTKSILFKKEDLTNI